MKRLVSVILIGLPAMLMLTALAMFPVQAQTGKGKPKKGDVITNSIGMKPAYIPPGTFSMGSPKGEADRSEDEEEYEVEITKGFHLGVYEVTQAEYEKVMGENPSYFSAKGSGKATLGGLDTSRFPVEKVS
jgi:formylglycine-generating enzyme required for sulfatase activity